MNRELLEQWLERVILGLTLAILVLMPLGFGGVRQAPVGSRFDFLLLNPFLVAQYLLLPLLIAWLVRLWSKSKPRLLFPPVCWFVLAFVVYASGRYLTADIEYVARQELIRILVYALLFFVVINNLHGQEVTHLVSYTLVFLGMALSFYAVYQYATGSDRVWHVLKPYPHRGSGTYICPNHLGGFLEMVLPLGLAFVLVGRIKPLGRIFVGYATLVILAGIAATVSRGTWAAVAVALVVFFGVVIANRHYRVPGAVALLLLVGGVAYFAPRSLFIQARVQQVYGTGKLDDDARFKLWVPALQIWQQNPWFGAGPAHFDYRFPQYRPETIQARPDRAHNDILNSLTDWGIAGTALVAGAWLVLGFGVLKTWRYVRKTPRDIGGTSSSSKFAFVLGASVGLLALLLHSVVDFNMHIPANALVAVTLFALLSSHLRFATSEYWFSLGAVSKVIVTLVVLGGAGYVGWHGVRQGRENAALALAERAPAYSQKQIELYKIAAELEPANPQTCDAIGQALRIQSMQGDANYREQALEAMAWFERALKLNPWNGDSSARYGWCLDWLDRQSESGPWFRRAEKLDPNGYMTMSLIGQHYVEARDFAAAKPWFERSLRLKPAEYNLVASNYVQIVDAKLRDGAVRAIAAPADSPK